jgi:hypothetical protein
MLGLLVAVTMVLLPFVGVVALLLLVGRLQRSQEARVAQQIAVTEAIHRELGAVVAPSMTKRPWGPPRLVIPVPLERPNVVAAVLAIAHRVLRGCEGGAAKRLQIVVVPQAEGPSTSARRAA